MFRSLVNMLRVLAVGLLVLGVGLMVKSFAKSRAVADACGGNDGLFPVVSAQVGDPSCWSNSGDIPPDGGNADGGCGNPGGEGCGACC